MSGVDRIVLATKLPAPGVIAAALIGALVVIAALALLMRRRPEAFPLLAILALPFRVPIEADNRTVNLLIPLYLVVAAGTVSWLAARLAGPGRRARQRAVRAEDAPARHAEEPPGEGGVEEARRLGVPARA